MKTAVLAGMLVALLIAPARAQSRYGDSDDYVCNHGAAADAKTVEACGRLRADNGDGDEQVPVERPLSAAQQPTPAASGRREPTLRTSSSSNAESSTGAWSESAASDDTAPSASAPPRVDPRAAALAANSAGIAAYNLNDFRTALPQYTAACDGGVAEGCYNLGIMHEFGEGVAKSKLRAAALYKRACNGGDAGACSRVGLMYLDGDGVKQNVTLAMELYSKACSGGDSVGCTALSVLNESAASDDTAATPSVSH